jgi:hypothetical protein
MPKNIRRYFLSKMLGSGVEPYTLVIFTKVGGNKTSIHNDVRGELFDLGPHAFTTASDFTHT